MSSPSPPRRALRAVLRRAERSVPAFAALVLGLGVVGAVALAAAAAGSLWVQAAGGVVFVVVAGCVIALVEGPRWLVLPAVAVFAAPSLAMVAVVGPRFSAAFDGPTRVTVAERVVRLPLSATGCQGLYRYTAEGERFARYLSHGRPCLPVHPVEYVVGSPETVRALPTSRVRRSTSPTPPPVRE